MERSLQPHPFDPSLQDLGWDCSHDNNEPTAPALAWRKETNYCWRSLGDTNYTIAAFRVGEDIKYRPSKAREFIAGHCDTADEAKAICTSNFILTHGMPA